MSVRGGSPAARPLARRIGLSAALFLAVVVCGLATRPLALALPWLYGGHALLMALPASFCIAVALRRGAGWTGCVTALVLFALLLSCMSPIMGMSSLIPVIAAALGGVVATRGGAQDRRADRGEAVFAAAYGMAYYPATVAVSVLFGGAFLSLTGSSLRLTATATVLGCALAVLGAVLGAMVRRSGKES